MRATSRTHNAPKPSNYIRVESFICEETYAQLRKKAEKMFPEEVKHSDAIC